MLRNSIRRERLRAGLTQTQLGEQVGATRQAIIAIERGKRNPSTSLALALARVLKRPVEVLFSLGDDDSIIRLDKAMAATGPVKIARVDGAWVAHSISEPNQLADGELVVDDSGSNTYALSLYERPERLGEQILLAGCAPLLGWIEAFVNTRHDSLRVSWIPCNSSQALDLLSAGRVHAAGVHFARDDDPQHHAQLARKAISDRDMSMVHLANWQTGLVTAEHNPLSLTPTNAPTHEALKWAVREDGSGANRVHHALFQNLGLSYRLDACHKAVLRHRDVASLVAHQVVDVGVAIEPVALGNNLGFCPIQTERFDVLVPSDRLGTPQFTALLELLHDSRLRRGLAHLAGYNTERFGQVLDCDVPTSHAHS